MVAGPGSGCLQAAGPAVAVLWVFRVTGPGSGCALGAYRRQVPALAVHWVPSAGDGNNGSDAVPRSTARVVATGTFLPKGLIPVPEQLQGRPAPAALPEQAGVTHSSRRVQPHLPPALSGTAATQRNYL